MDDQRPTPTPLLAQPWSGGVTGWIVVSGAVIAEVVGGATVANQMSAAIVVPVLIFPVVVAFGFAVVQWWHVRSSAAEPTRWWHLAGIAAAALTWVVWPTVPAVLASNNASGADSYCAAMTTTVASGCLHRAAQAADGHSLAWWSTGAVILIAALLVRRSRIAAWAAIPVALAGCQLATNFLNQFVLYYQLLLPPRRIAAAWPVPASAAWPASASAVSPGRTGPSPLNGRRGRGPRW